MQNHKVGLAALSTRVTYLHRSRLAESGYPHVMTDSNPPVTAYNKREKEREKKREKREKRERKKR